MFLFITIDGLFANGKANLKTYIRVLFQVLKYGTALGRSIDLARFDGYDELIIELDQMFDFGGSLMDGSCRWHVTYTDDEGDMMLLGDYPWQFSTNSNTTILNIFLDVSMLEHSC